MLLYLVTFLAGLIFAKSIGGGAWAGIIVGVVATVLLGGLGLAIFAAAAPGLLALLGPQLLVEIFIFGLTGAAGGLVRSLIAEKKA